MANTVLELSNAHITEKDNGELSRMVEETISKHDFISKQPLNIGEMYYGYCIVIPEAEEYVMESIEECQRLGYELSEDFYNILWHARRNDYRVIIFDRDAEVLDELPTHDW